MTSHVSDVEVLAESSLVHASDDTLTTESHNYSPFKIVMTSSLVKPYLLGVDLFVDNGAVGLDD